MIHQTDHPQLIVHDTSFRGLFRILPSIYDGDFFYLFYQDWYSLLCKHVFDFSDTFLHFNKNLNPYKKLLVMQLFGEYEVLQKRSISKN